jgi:nitroreductase
MDTQGLQTFLELARTRRSVRDFLPDPVPAEVIDQLLEAARWAPSGYNLQPVHYVVVTDPDRRQALRKASMNQRQIAEAPTVVVLVADRHVAKRHTDRVLTMDVEAGAADDTYRALMRKFVGLAFATGPAGLNWLWKALLAPKALNLPRGLEPMLMVPIGYPARTDLKKTRLPLADLIHREEW